MCAKDIRDFFDLAGEKWEIRRGGQVVLTVEGIRVKKEEWVQFEPETDVRVGDEITGKKCKKTDQVTNIDSVIAEGDVFCVEAFYSQPRTDKAVHTFNVGTAIGSALMVDSTGAKTGRELHG